MKYINAFTHMGYSHKKINKPCQDFSFAYKDKTRYIIGCCDGHGGDVYIRSKIGSYLACRALFNVFITLNKCDIERYGDVNNENKLKLAVLCEWNKLVEMHLSKHPIRKRELEGLDQEAIDTLLNNKVKAYGTTLSGALAIDNKILVVAIGDSEQFIVNKGEICRVFDDEDEPVGNITYSMCQEDAFNHIKVRVINSRDVDGIILCTDGVSSPYQSYDNFHSSFIKPLMNKVLIVHDIKYVNDFITNLGEELGNGDDVSLAFIIDQNCNKKYYI